MVPDVLVLVADCDAVVELLLMDDDVVEVLLRSESPAKFDHELINLLKYFGFN